MYASGGGAQLHDFNPGIDRSGLFWTRTVPPDNVDVDLDAGTATFAMQDVHMMDFLTFQNAVLGGGPPPRPGAVSFRVTWNSGGAAPIPNDVAAKRFHGEHAFAEATMEWSGYSGDFTFQSHPASQSSAEAALLGSHRNGSFY